MLFIVDIDISIIKNVITTRMDIIKIAETEFENIVQSKVIIPDEMSAPTTIERNA